MLDAPYFFTWRADGVVWFLDASSPTRAAILRTHSAQPDSQARPLGQAFFSFNYFFLQLRVLFIHL